MIERSYLFTMWDGGGNVPPELGLIRQLIARGHRVRVLGDPTLEGEVATTGAGFTPWTTAPHLTDRAPEHAIIKDWELTNPIRMLSTYLQDFLSGPAPRWAADTGAALDAERFDAVIADFGVPATLIAAEARGLPTAITMPNIWILPTKGIPPIGPGFAPSSSPFGRARDAVARFATTKAFDKGLPGINEVRVAHGLPEVRSTIDQMARADRILVMTSPAFDITSPAMPANVRYVGPMFDDPPWVEPWTSPWPADDARPLVVVGLSSTFQDQAAVLRRAVEALAELPVRALVTLGEAIDPAQVPPQGDVVVVRSAPHSQVIPQASVLVTHCGHGTAMKGLRSGLPLVCVPMGRDQNDTAARVVHHGAGVRLKPTASTAKLRGAIERALDDRTLRAGAARLQAAITERTGCSDAVAELEALAAARTPPTPLAS